MNELFNFAIDNAALTHDSEISYSYYFEDKNVCVSFYQDEAGKSIIEQFLFNYNGSWISILPNKDQILKMFKKLDSTPYQEVVFEESEIILDMYEYYGVKQSDFI